MKCPLKNRRHGKDIFLILLPLCNAIYKQNSIEKWTKTCFLPFSKKGDLGITKNYGGISLTAISSKVYNSLLLNRIRHNVGKMLRKNQNAIKRNHSTTSHRMSRCKNSWGNNIIHKFKSIWLYSQKDGAKKPLLL